MYNIIINTVTWDKKSQGMQKKFTHESRGQKGQKFPIYMYVLQGAYRLCKMKREGKAHVMLLVCMIDSPFGGCIPLMPGAQHCPRLTTQPWMDTGASTCMGEPHDAW